VRGPKVKAPSEIENEGTSEIGDDNDDDEKEEEREEEEEDKAFPCPSSVFSSAPL